MWRRLPSLANEWFVVCDSRVLSEPLHLTSFLSGASQLKWIRRFTGPAARRTVARSHVWPTTRFSPLVNAGGTSPSVDVRTQPFRYNVHCSILSFIVTYGTV